MGVVGPPWRKVLGIFAPAAKTGGVSGTAHEGMQAAMTDNLDFGPDAQVNHAIAMLRGGAQTARIVDGLRLSPDVFLAVDPQGRIEGTSVTGGGSVLRLSYRVAERPRWLALHLGLGGLDLADHAVLGLVCKSCAPLATTIHPCLRSGGEGGFVDAPLPKHVVAHSDISTHVDLLRLDDARVPGQAPWRELILFFQTSSAEIDIRDLRVFIV